MASGLPDYHVEYKVTTGGVIVNYGVKNIASIGSYELFSLSGKGIILGGHVRASAAAGGHDSDSVKLTIDGNSMRDIDFGMLNDWSMTKMYSTFLHLIHFDNTNYNYAVGFPNQISFESSIVCDYTTVTGACTVVHLLLYSLFV